MVSISIFLMLNATDKLFTCLLVVYCACPVVPNGFFSSQYISWVFGRAALPPSYTQAWCSPQKLLYHRAHPMGLPPWKASRQGSLPLFTVPLWQIFQRRSQQHVWTRTLFWSKRCLFLSPVNLSGTWWPLWIRKGRQHKLCSVTPERSQRSCSFRLAPSLSWISSLRNPATVLWGGFHPHREVKSKRLAKRSS